MTGDSGSKAVFLSYASQDAAAVLRLAEALRTAGVEVWFDQNELVGGDAWDAKIRGQIASCALFVPVISANTQARHEGYFRLEWKLAAQRTHMMSGAKAFLLPVVIDETRDAEAHVPAEFKDVQWTRLPGGETATAFCSRVRKLLGHEGWDPSPRGVDAASTENGERRGKPSSSARRAPAWWFVVAAGAVAAGVLGIWQPWRKVSPVASPASVAKAPDSAVDAELAGVRARVVPERWQQSDFEAVSSTLDRLILANPENADAWALRSIINSLQVLRVLDSGTKPLEIGKTAANRALRLAPDRPLGNLALGLHLTAMVSRGGDPRAGRDLVDQALPGLSVDALTRYAGVASVWMGYDFAETSRRAHAYLEAEPSTSYPAWILGLAAFATRRADDALAWAERAATAEGVTVVRALSTVADVNYYLRADLIAARAALDRVPARYRFVHRVVHGRWLITMAEQHWDQALQDLAQLPDAFLSDVSFSGPKALLAGITHRRAGRDEAARAQFHEAERVVRERLVNDAENEELRAVLALTLAYAGRAAEARSELALIEPLVRTRAANVHRFKVVMPIAQTYGVLGDFPAMAGWLRMQFAEPSQAPLTPASFRSDARFAGTAQAPEIQALLQEFSWLDQKPKDAMKAESADQKSVAVLAFANLSDDKANEYFSDGISEELLNVLAKVPGLKVTARTSAFHFKGKDTPIPEIARQLGVAYVIEGSVRKAGDKVRITAQVIKAADGFHIWSETFTRDLKDVFAVQDEIAGLIASALSLRMGVVGPRPEVPSEAYELYIRAREAWNLRNPAGYDQAEALLSRALKIAPRLAKAHAALADVWELRAEWGAQIGRYEQRDSVVVRAIREKIDVALKLDPQCAEAYASLGLLCWNSWRHAEAEQALRNAIQINPNYASAHQWLGRVLLSSGRMDEALAAFRRASELDPLSRRILDNYAWGLNSANRPREALIPIDRALELQPDSQQALLLKAWTLTGLGRGREAAALALSERRNLEFNSTLRVLVLARTGERGAAEEQMAAAAKATNTQVLGLCILGKHDDALAALRPGGFEFSDMDLIYSTPELDPIRTDPKFRAALAEVGLLEAHDRAQAWRKAHPPEKVEGKQ